MTVCLVIFISAIRCTPQETLSREDATLQSPKSSTQENALFLSPSERRFRQNQMIAADLTDTLKQLEGVVDAKVHLNPSDNSLMSRHPDAPGRAAVLISHENAPSLSKEAIQELTAAAVKGLNPNQVTVYLFKRTSPPRKATVFLGPIEVTADTLGNARAILGALIACCIIMALALIGAGLKMKLLRRKSSKE